MTEQDYNAAEGVRRSALWLIRESPEKFQWAVNHPENPTPALVFGSMVHKWLLQPRSFTEDYVIAPNVDRRTKAGKEEWQRYVERAGDKTLVSIDDWNTARDMAAAVKKHRIAKELIKGRHEVPFFWTDEDTGERCKVKLDCIHGTKKRPIIVDYKTANNAKTEVFNRKLFEFGYHLQAFMYTEAVRITYKLAERPEFVFVVQEKKPPYSVNVIRVMDDVMGEGENVFRELIGIYHQCQETGYWYGYNGPFDEMSEAWLPGYLADSMGEEE